MQGRYFNSPLNGLFGGFCGCDLDAAPDDRGKTDLYSFFGHGFRNFPHGCGYDIRCRGKDGKWPTRDEARHAVVEFIESYYNRRRPHSTIGYRIPAEAMDGFFERTEPMLETAHEQAAGKLSKAA